MPTLDPPTTTPEPITLPESKLSSGPEKTTAEHPDHRPGRRVVRIVRRVQLWSVFKIALIGSVLFFAVCMLALTVLWSLAASTGQIHHIEKFMRDIGFDDWTFDAGVLFPAALAIGAISAIASTVLITLAAAVMNLVSELTGGLRFTVIETLDTDHDA